HVEADTPRVAVVVDAERVLPWHQRAARHGGRGLFVGADVVAERIALAGHAEIERADVAQEAVEILRANGIAGEGSGALGVDLRARRRRSKIFEADRPVVAAMTARAT